MIYSPTRAKIQAMARYFLEDANVGKTWKNWQINTAINNAIEFLQFQIVKLDKGWFERTTSFGLTSGVGTYTLPSGVAKIKSVEITTDSGRTWTPLPRAWVTQLVRSTNTSTFPTCYFLLGGRQIGIYPVPQNTVAYGGPEAGPIRIVYIEKLPRFTELDNPTTFATQAGPDSANESYETYDIAHQVMQGPALSFDLDEVAVSSAFIPIRYFHLIALFTKRDKDKSRYSPPEQIGMPWVSPYTALTVAQTSNCKLNITKWPLGDPDNSEWPDDATHLDLWLYVSGNPANAVLNPLVGGNYHDMVFLGNILPEDNWADGSLTFNQLGGAKESFSPGASGKGIWDGRYVTTLTPAGLLGGFSDANHVSRWIHQIPPTPYVFTSRWAPYAPDSAYVNLPNTGTGVYFDTNPALGDGDIIGEDITDDHVEILGMRAALNLLARHGIFNQILMKHYLELFENFKEFFASRDSSPRLINLTNPDTYQTPSMRAADRITQMRQG